MLTQIAYVRQQIAAAQRAGTPSARADHLQRAMDGLARVEWQAKEFAADVLIGDTDIDEDAMIPDPFIPSDADIVCFGPNGEPWTYDDIVRREA